MGAPPCWSLTRDDSPPLAAACQWSSSGEAVAQSGHPGVAPLRLRTPAPRLPVRFCSPPAVRPTCLSNSFAVLADLNDEEAWPLPHRDSDRMEPVSCTSRKCRALNLTVEEESSACVPPTTDTLDDYTTDTLDDHHSGPATTDTLDYGQCSNCEAVGTLELRHICRRSCLNYTGELPNAPASAAPGRRTLDMHSNRRK